MLIKSFDAVRGADSREVMRAAILDGLAFTRALYRQMLINPYITQDTWQNWIAMQERILDVAQEFKETAKWQ